MAKDKLMAIEPINKQLINKIETINVDNLPPVKHLIMFGKPVEQLPREKLIQALYIIVREMKRIKLETN